ncbi:MAG: hypothetical protein CBC13_00470, partial [Planctomycetia bacterium TMED53]
MRITSVLTKVFICAIFSLCGLGSNDSLLHAQPCSPDNTAPQLTAADTTLTVPASTDCLATIDQANLLGTISVTDNCSAEADITVISTPTALTNVPSGDYTVIWSATDQAGNVAIVSQTITLVVTDNTDPTISGMPTAIALDADANCEAVATWTEPTA